MLKVVRRDTLPPLAWLARVRGATARAVCGRGVVVDEDGLFEGAWLARGEASTCADASEVFGSGLQLVRGRWTAVPPSHLLEGLYVLRHNTAGEWIVSNSLALLAAETGLSFLERGVRLLTPFAEAAVSVRDTPARTITSEGFLHLLYVHNALLGDELRLLQKLPPPRFKTFQRYRDYLLQTLSAVQAQSQRSFLTTISSGYDSVACAALAAASGCEVAATFRTARGGAADSGAQAAYALGLEIVELDRPFAADKAAAAMFASAGLGGEDALYAVLEERLKGQIFVTGFHGDKVWDLHGKANAGLRRGDLSGASLGEFRLRADFVHVPAPFIGAHRLNDVLALSRSDELAVYRIGGAYDRPIPRRIGEEAGVPRRAFGMAKRAVSLRRMTAVTGGAFLERWRYRIGVALWRVVHGGARRMDLRVRAQALSAAEAIFEFLFKQPFAVFEHTAPQAEQPFLDGLEQMAARYRAAIADWSRQPQSLSSVK